MASTATATATSTAALTATSTTKPGSAAVNDTTLPAAPAAAKGKFKEKFKTVGQKYSGKML